MALKSSEKIVPENKKSKPRRLKVGDPNFVPPDGGWGWLIVFACGFSNLSTFPMFQQFGLVFRGKFEEIGISETQTTSIINLNSAFNAGMGLINGPLFRKFTYRQVAMFGSCLVAGSLFLCAFCESFVTYLIFYAMCYGTYLLLGMDLVIFDHRLYKNVFSRRRMRMLKLTEAQALGALLCVAALGVGCKGSGIGITQSSNALALNTYFKEKRRIATGFSWTTTALGPIVWPYIIVVLNELYGMEGTLLFFSGFALHSFVCSLLLHPVEWHTNFKTDGPEASHLLEKLPQPHQNKTLESGKLSRKSSHSIFSSQYLRNEDDPFQAGYEITDPGTPMMIKANDGWYSQSRSQIGSRLSLHSNKGIKQTSGQNSIGVSKRPSYNNLADHGREYRKRERKMSQSKPVIREEVEDLGNDASKDDKKAVQPQISKNYPNEKEVLKSAAKKLEAYKEKDNEPPQVEEAQQLENLSLLKKISIFFDFELFKDFTYVNLMLGITVANFAELNFSILTPIILEEFGFEKYETATFMSLLGITDIVIRFFIPFIADKIGWSNRTFFLLGVMSMALGRIILVHTQTYSIGLLVAVIIGAGKALRTIFMALVIPSYVPLERLPAASGLQLATSGLLFIILGPLVGWIREVVENYVVTLHILNICTYATAVAWTAEMLKSRKKTQPIGK